MRLLGLARFGVFSTLLLLAGCGSEAGTAPATQPVTEKDWKTVIADWYEKGRFDHTHRCIAVREAIEHLPGSSPNYQPLHQDFRALEARAC